MTNKLDKIYTYRITHPNIGGHFILNQVDIEYLQKSDYILIFWESLTLPLGLIIHWEDLQDSTNSCIHGYDLLQEKGMVMG